MNDLKTVTLDEIKQLDKWDRMTAMARWHRHNKKRWEQVRKEIKASENKIGRFKRKKCSQQKKTNQ